MITASWIPYALLPALFAARIAIFTKIGIKGADSDLAITVRTTVILLLAWGIAIAHEATAELPALTQCTPVFWVLSELATGALWRCYFRALRLGPVTKAAPIDKLSVALAVALVYVGGTVAERWAQG